MKYYNFQHTMRAAGILSLSLFIFLQGCESKGDNGGDPAKKTMELPDSLTKTLQITTVKSSSLVNTLTLTGKVAFDDDNVLKLYPMVSGNVQDIKVMLGDYVQKGQVLAVIRSSEMAGYSNDLVTAQTNVALAKKNLDATEDMSKSGLASARDLLAAQSGYEQAKAALEKAQRILQINGGNINGEFQVKAPISGFVVEKFVTNNMAIRSDNGGNLFTISDLKTVWIMANVYESGIADVKNGEPVEITTLSYPGKIFDGKIDRIMNVLDPTNKVMKVRIVLANPGYLLKPEMFANVTINVKGNKQMPAIPAGSLVFDNNQYYVLVYKSPKDITIRPVQVANTTGGIAFIASGLAEGEQIITDQALLVYQQLNS